MTLVNHIYLNENFLVSLTKGSIYLPSSQDSSSTESSLNYEAKITSIKDVEETRLTPSNSALLTRSTGLINLTFNT